MNKKPDEKTLIAIHNTIEKVGGFKEADKFTKKVEKPKGKK
jgi:hypothetical protein